MPQGMTVCFHLNRQTMTGAMGAVGTGNRQLTRTIPQDDSTGSQSHVCLRHDAPFAGSGRLGAGHASLLLGGEQAIATPVDCLPTPAAVELMGRWATQITMFRQ